MEKEQDSLLRASGFIREPSENDDTQAVIDQFHVFLNGVVDSSKIEQIEELFREAQQTASRLKTGDVDDFTKGALIRLNRRRLAKAVQIILN